MREEHFKEHSIYVEYLQLPKGEEGLGKGLLEEPEKWWCLCWVT